MSRYIDWHDEDEPLVRGAVLALVETHYDEYRELAKGVLSSQIDGLLDDMRRQEAEMRKLRDKLTKAEADKARWKQRMASGVTQKRGQK